MVMDNDMNCGVLGEYVFGAGKGVNRLMVMTVGTGIGMSVVLNGEVFRRSAGHDRQSRPHHRAARRADLPGGVPGMPGKCCILRADHTPRRRTWPAPNDPRRWRRTLAAKGSLTPEDLFEAAESGDVAAQETWLEIGAWLGRGFASWVEIFTPEVVIVGGGVAKAGHWLIDPSEAEMRRTGEPYFTRQVREVKQSQLGQELAMLGAASFYLYPEYAPHQEAGSAA